MNKVFLYHADPNLITEVDFLFFNSNAEILENISGSLNVDDIWEATIPITLPADEYDVVAISGTSTLGEEKLVWDGSSIVDSASHLANTIREELNTELAHLISLQNGLTENQAIMLLELYNLMGLSPTKPLIVTKTRRYVGNGSEIDQTIESTNEQTKVTRQV